MIDFRRALRSWQARLTPLGHDLVDRHTRFMAFVWGPDWQLKRDGIPETQAVERRR
jgi:hypothetical protein